MRFRFGTSSRLDAPRKKRLLQFAKQIGVHFRNLDLLDQALTHSSFRNEGGAGRPKIEDNQRLEYLGDSVLGLVINEYLYASHPDYPEGQLARIKSSVVSEQALAPIGADLGLGQVLRMGRGEASSGGAERSSNLADGLEALIGAVYLDRGLNGARKFILGRFQPLMDAFDDPRDARDAKSRLQELVQKRIHRRPVYELVSESGPDHRRVFECRVLVGGKETGRGTGRSRKRAEQAAATDALERMQKKENASG